MLVFVSENKQAGSMKWAGVEDDTKMFWGHHMMGYGGWGLLIGALLWIGLIALGIWLLARLFPGVGRSERRANVERRSSAVMPPVDTDTGPHADAAMQILRRRYARGEITKEEYETIRHDLAS